MHYCWQSVSDDGKIALEGVDAALCGPQGARGREREREGEGERERERETERERDRERVCVYALMQHCIDRKVRQRKRERVCVCVCVCMCESVCMREKGRERDKACLSESH